MNKTQIITRIPPEAEQLGPPFSRDEQTLTSPSREKDTLKWQYLLASAITDPEALLSALDLPVDLLKGARLADRSFHLKVTQSYLQRMEKANPADPLLLQVLPQLAETSAQPENFSADPVAEQDAMQTPGLLHKYHGRVLLITTEACAIHCRYCFRREFPYQQAQAGRDHWAESIDYIAADNSIEEVILSGGDPLVLADRKLGKLVTRLSAIKHVRRLRIHSRLPIVLPQRITTALLDWMSHSRLQVILVVHSNHPHEIDAEVGRVLKKIDAAGVTLLNQSVLLHQVNDTVETLIDLSNRLLENKTLPYYLHTLDPVTGSAHFAVPESRVIELYNQLSTKLPGYLIPKLAKEIPGMPAKSVIAGFSGPFI